MRRQRVLLEHALIMKPTFAPWAFELEISRMYSLVCIQLVILLECFRTQITLKISSIRMADHVLPQIAFGREFQIALRAFNKSLSRVPTHMMVQQRGRGQRFATHLTTILMIAVQMRAFVRQHIVPGLEGLRAFVALEIALIGMCVHVLF